MRRREVISGIACAGTLLVPRPALAQRGARIPRLAIANVTAASTQAASSSPFFAALLAELEKRGYVDGKTIAIEWWSAGGNFAQFPELAAKIVRSAPDLIFVSSTEFALALKEATSTFPVVALTTDPVTNGLVASLARPGGNMTGVSVDMGAQGIGENRVKLVREILPHASRIAYLAPRSLSRVPGFSIQNAIVRKAGIEVVELLLDSPVNERGFQAAFETLKTDKVDLLVVSSNSENSNNAAIIIRMAAEHGVPAIYHFRAVALGGLISHWTGSLDDYGRRSAEYIDRVLKGASTAEIPVYQPTTASLGINLKTARALGMTIPTTLLVRADEVIE